MKKKILIIGICLIAALLLGAAGVDHLVIQPLVISSFSDIFEHYLEVRESMPPLPLPLDAENILARMEAGNFSFLQNDHWFVNQPGSVLYAEEGSELAKTLKLPLKIMAVEDVRRGEITIYGEDKNGPWKGLALFDAPPILDETDPFYSTLTAEEKKQDLYRALSETRVRWIVTLKPEAEMWTDFVFQRDAAVESMSLPEEGGMMAMSGGSTNEIWVLKGEAVSNGVVVPTWCPPGVTNIELYCTTSLFSNWVVAVENLMPADGTNVVRWLCTSEEKTLLFRAGDGSEDFDGDSLPDARESIVHQTDPADADTDGDFMTDGWEILYGLNPLDDSDGTEDPDNDGFANGYEYMNGETNPTNALSIPTPTVVVSTNGHDSTYTNIQTAVDAATSNAWPIILIEPGTYTGNGNRDIVLTNEHILIYGTNAATVIDCEDGGRAFYITSGHPVISGLIMQNGWGSKYGGAIYMNQAEALIRNCVFQNNGAEDDGGAIYSQSSVFVLDSCTLIKNRATWASVPRGAAIYGSSSAIEIRNCLIWANEGLEQIYWPYDINISVSHSCVEDRLWPGTGNTTNNPGFISNSWRLATTNSSCWKSGLSSNAPVTDIDGEARAGGVDIGADQVLDADGDGLTDWFELNRVPATDHLDANSDDDGLNDYEEIHLHHTDPLDADSDDDGLDDDKEIAEQTDPWISDTDGDGLSDGDEVNQHNTNPLLTDSDGDGLSDYEEVILYSSDPFVHDSMLDSDSDEILDILDSSPTNSVLPAQGSCIIIVDYPLDGQILN